MEGFDGQLAHLDGCYWSSGSGCCRSGVWCMKVP